MRLPTLKSNSYVDLDALLDVGELIGLHSRIAYAIASSPRTMSSAGTLLPRAYGAGSIQQASEWFKQLAPSHPLKSEVPEFEDYDHLQRYLYWAVEAIHTGDIIVPLRRTEADMPGIQTGTYAVFAPFIEWLRRQEMFERIDQVTVFTTPQGGFNPIHRHENDAPNAEFIWLRPLLQKRFFLYDPESAEAERTKPVLSRSAWFNLNQYHGVHQTHVATYSMSIMGRFTDKVREIIGNAVCGDRSDAGIAVKAA